MAYTAGRLSGTILVFSVSPRNLVKPRHRRLTKQHGTGKKRAVARHRHADYGSPHLHFWPSQLSGEVESKRQSEGFFPTIGKKSTGMLGTLLPMAALVLSPSDQYHTSILSH